METDLVGRPVVRVSLKDFLENPKQVHLLADQNNYVVVYEDDEIIFELSVPICLDYGAIV